MSRNTQSRVVSLFIPTFAGGGAERVIVTLANQFSVMGYCVDLVVLSAKGPYKAEVFPSVNIVDLNTTRAARGVFAFARYLRQRKPDAVLVTMTHIALCAFYARILAARTNKTALFVREAIAPSFLDNIDGLAASLRRRALSFMYRHVDGVVSTTPEMTRQLRERYRIPHLHTIGNPVVTAQFKSALNADEKPAWPWDKHAPIIVGIGRLGDQKDFKTLIKAYARLAEHRAAKLVILGEGENRQALTELIAELGVAENVWMPGFVENPFAYLLDADLFVLSSTAEGLPNVLIQALCTGIPVVSTRCPTGPVDLLDNGTYGELVMVGDVEAMATSMKTSLDTATFDVQRQKHFMAEFSVDRVANAYTKLLFGD